MEPANHRHDQLVSPEQRIQAVPVTCVKHSGHFGWDGLRVEDYPNLPESDFLSPAMDHHLLVYHYKALEGEFRHECAGRKTATRLQSGQLSFIPAGADNHWDFGKGAPSALHILIDMSTFDQATATTGLELKDDFQVTSKRLRHLAMRLQMELRSDGATGALFADTIVQMVCEDLARLFGNNGKPAETNTCNVSVARDLIAAEFDRRIPLAELAGLCGLSQSQLLRAFQRQYGITPHQYLLDRRVHTAKRQLLADVDTPIAQIALDLGFADQSHFTRLFSKSTGVTPDRFRLRS